MKELTIPTMIAVFEEIFGGALFWAIVIAAAAITIAFIYLIVREHRLEGSRLLRAELWAPVGAIAAILFVQFITSSGFSDIGGPIDVVVLIAIALVGGIGLTMLVYVAMGFFSLRRRDDRTGAG